MATLEPFWQISEGTFGDLPKVAIFHIFSKIINALLSIVKYRLII